MKRIHLKLTFLFFTLMSTFFASAQLNGEHYVYEHDTLIIAEDSNIYQVENLGVNINSSHVESGPRISPDGETLYFFRVDHPKNISGTEDIWSSNFQKEDSSWSEATHLDEPINCHGQNAVHWISKDGKTLLLHNEYYKNGTVGNGLSISYKEDGEWSFPKKMKIKGYKNEDVCSFYLTDSQDALIMCIRQKKKSENRQDLYISFPKGKSGRKWSKPESMGDVLNTKGTEATAWINHKEDTMYFSSDGHRGSVGGMDIYRTVRLDTTRWDQWSKPVNLGEPYNTPDDEYYFTIPDKGDYIYMAHHFGLNGDTLPHSDIVRIRLKDKFIEPALFVSGYLIDDFTKDTIPGKVTFKLFDSGEIEVVSESNVDLGYKAKLPGREKYSYTAEGELGRYIPKDGTIDVTTLTRGEDEKSLNIYLKRKPGLLLSGFEMNEVRKEDTIPGTIIITLAGTDKVYKTINVDSILGYEAFLEPGQKYDLKYNSRGYLSKIETIDLTGLSEYKEQEKDMYLLPLEEGIQFEIKNIFFALDKADLLPTSFNELDNLVNVMKDFPMIIVEISGHTDSQGSDVYNQNLSQRRSQSVVNYLIKEGIPKAQFVAKGYGETVPVATNETREGRQLNRRVEFKILKINK